MRATAIGAAALVFLSAGAALADTDFYKGKQIRLISSTEPGLVYDVYSRLLARHMPRYIPGNPTIIVQNMPGAGGIKATNFAYTVAPRDGTVIVGPHSGIPTAPLTMPNAAQFDVNKISWIGSITKDPLVGYVWHTSPVQSLEEAKNKEVIMGGTGAGTASVDAARLATAILGLKIKLVPGYKSAGEVRLAMERGEIHGSFGHAWHGLKTTNEDWIQEKKVKLIVQHSIHAHPELPDVPLLIDLAKTEADRQAVIFLLAVRQEAGKPYLAPPDVPEDRLAILRRAFDATMKDPQFLKDAKGATLPVEGPLRGDELAALVSRVAATPSSVVERVMNMLKN
jgi:tripartite-type tricarboxylate transporter receptor subunit TctC